MNNTVLSPELYQENLDFWARAWDMVKTPYTQMPDLAYIPKIPQAIAAKKHLPVLDLGCGSGWLSVYLGRGGFKVLGVDVAEHAVELARQWALSENLDIEFLESDISALDLEAGRFGSVVANSIFEHLSMGLAEKTVDSLEKILAPGGLLVACFDFVGTGPGEYFKLEDGTHVYTDKGRKGMMLRCFDDREVRDLFAGWNILEFERVTDLTRFFVAEKK